MKKSGTMMLVGVDEVGRGPLAGPVAVGIVTFPKYLEHKVLKVFGEVKDSKKLSEKERNVWFKKINTLKKEGVLEYKVLYKSPLFIDTHGISKAIKSCMKTGLTQLAPDTHLCEIRLDGSLYAPTEYVYQKTIIKGDEKEIVIALASIVAKVSRDRLMVRSAKKYPYYAFERHKGYGTLEHRLSIQTYGLSAFHRRSFCTRFTAEK